MKILHTSDWHLGHQLYGYDRTEEQQDMIRQISRIAAEERPDVFLLCGDVFHVANPPAGVQKMLVDSIFSLMRANTAMKIIVIAGNHDSGVRHEVFRSPWNAMGVEVIGVLHPENPEEHIFEIEGKGWVVAVPYANERFIPDGFFEDVLDRVAKRNTGNLPVVMMAHTTVCGADFSGHENPELSMIGGIEGVDVERFGSGYDYLALGHIHREQSVDSGHNKVRYSGTPLAVSFDETHTHSVSIVEIDSHSESPVVKTIEIENLRPLVNLPIEGFTDWETALQLLAEFPDGQEAYIRLNVEVDNFMPNGAADEARTIAESKRCRFCGINSRRRRGADGAPGDQSMTVSEFKEVTPVDIARRYVEQKGGEFTDEMKEMFKEAINRLELQNEA